MVKSSTFSLNQVIERHPLTVAPNTPAIEAIALMNCTGASAIVVVEELACKGARSSQITENTPAPGKVKLSPLLGIFTERDVVRVTASGAPLEGVAIASLITQSIISITESEAPDILVLLNLFVRHQIRHLPVVDNFGQLLGIITPTSLLAGAISYQCWDESVSASIGTSDILPLKQQFVEQQTDELNELRKSQAKCKVLLELLSIGISITDKQGNIIEANKTSEQILSISVEEHKTRRCDSEAWQIMRPDGSLMPTQEFASVRALQENKIIENVEMGIVKQGDEITWISVTAAPIPLKDYGVAIAYNDITKRVRTEEKLEKSLSLLRAILESTADGIIAIGLQGDILGFNQKFVQMWQVPDVIMTSPDPDRRLAFIMNQLKDPGPFYKRLKEVYDRPEEKFYDILELKNGKIFERYSLPHHLGEQTIRVWSFRDITEQKRAEEALRSSVEREQLLGRITQRIRQSLQLDQILNTAVAEVRSFLHAERVALYRIDEAGNSDQFVVESVASACPSVLGVALYDSNFDKEYAQKYQAGYVSAIDDIYQADLSPCYVNLLASTGIRANLVVPLVVNDELWGLLCVHQCSGPRHWEQFEIELLQQLATGLAIAIQQSSLFQKLQEANQELHRLASLDGLTQLANRRRFDEYLDIEWRRQAREKAPLSLILCDIDCFKIYNDTYGHLAGDLCLRQVAGSIRLAVRRPADLVARYGGEEIAVILPNTPAAGALYIAECIRSLVKDLEIVHVHSPASPYVTLSLGVASFVPKPNSSPAALIAAADEALYQAKMQGRDRAVLSK